MDSRLLVLIAAVVVFRSPVVPGVRWSAGHVGSLVRGTRRMVQQLGHGTKHQEVAITDESSVVVIGISVSTGSHRVRALPARWLDRPPDRSSFMTTPRASLCSRSRVPEVIVAFQSDGLAVARFLGDGTLDPASGRAVPHHPLRSTVDNDCCCRPETDAPRSSFWGFSQSPVFG